MSPLLPSVRRALRARAHVLHPVVSIGQHGLTPAVVHEIDVALLAHELVKVRVFNDDRAARSAMLADICAALGCAPVQQIGKLLLLWRARPPAERPSPTKKSSRAVRQAPAAPPGPTLRRRRTADMATGDDKTGARSPSVEPPPRSRPGTPGKAPSGVPRAAAPRRRRRAR